MFTTLGEQAQWRTVYNRLADMNVDDLITYDELAALLPDAAEGSVRSAVYRATKELETQNQRTVDNVRGKGYRIVHAREHERLALDQHRKARRRMVTAKRKVTSADRSKLTNEERARFDALELHIARQADMLRRVDTGLKTERRERKAQTAQLSEETANLSEKVDRLVSLLERHGIAVEK